MAARAGEVGTQRSAAQQAGSAAAVPAPSERSLLAQLETQPSVRDFLSRAVSSGRSAQAYLFIGASGSGKLDAAWALAQALLCEQGGCGACDSCIRVARRTHPDVHCYAPESATGYLIDQVRDLLADVSLAPIRAKRKVYIIQRADQLRANTANALLKTLEEPPESVTFVLLGTSADTILPTIVSRCQCVPFRMLSTDEAVSAVVRKTGLSESRCRMAVSVAGSPARAAEFLKSDDRLEARRQMLRAIDALRWADEADILSMVSKPKPRTKGGSGSSAGRKAAPEDLMSAIQAPLDGLKEAQEAVLEQNADYFSRGAIKQLEDRNKRELSARERSSIMEVLASARSLLRDVLITCEGLDEPIVNEDAADIVERIASGTSTAGAIRALDAVSSAEARISGNTSPQLTLEVMLFDIRKALQCPS